jgi:hypothetical protein
MSSINRCLLVTKPKQPVLEWLRTNDPGEEGYHELSDIEGDSTAYLVPEYADDEEQQEILQEFYPFIFEQELLSWDLDESAWPKNRDLDLFLEWFEVEFHSMVIDLAEGMPIQDLEYGNDPDDNDVEFD